MSSQCEQIKKELEDLKTLKKEFVLERQKATETGNLVKAKELKVELEQKRDALSEKLWPFENLPKKELKKQYESQKEMLEQVGILEKLSTGEMGIKAIDNKEYAFPNYQEIVERMKENKEILESKTEQGFSQLLITPFGMKLDDLIEKYKQVLIKHYQEGRLLTTKEKPSDPDEHLGLNEDEPVRIRKEYQNADTQGKLKYFPKESSQKHQGRTKQEILRKQGGFNVMFIEDLPNIPKQGEGKKIKGRTQLEADQKPSTYLEILKTNPIYQNETGMTPEEQITYAIKYLEQTNQVIDDVSGKGSASYQLGAYFVNDGEIPIFYWSRKYNWAKLFMDIKFNDPFSHIGTRTAVRV